MNRFELHDEPALQVKNEAGVIAHLTALSLGSQSTWVASEDIRADICKIKYLLETKKNLLNCARTRHPTMATMLLLVTHGKPRHL